jgi:uncharacterized protein (TIGR03546 family)
MIKGIARLIMALNANSRPWEIGAGAAFGLLLALVPGGNLLWIALFVLTFFLKLNMATQFLLMGVLRLLVPLVDPALDGLGSLVLTAPFLQGLFTSLSSAPVVPLTRFSNTLVMGGLIAGIVLWAPCFLLFTSLVKLYRRTLRERVANSRLAQAVSRVPLFAAIAKAAAGMGGAAGLGS